MRAAVGQVLTVVFKNNLGFPVNLQPAGLQAYLPPGTAANADAAALLSPPAQPNATVTYRFLVPAAAGPSANEPSAKLWLYRWGSAGTVCRRPATGMLRLGLGAPGECKARGTGRTLGGLQGPLSRQRCRPPCLGLPAPQVHRRPGCPRQRRPGWPPAHQVRAAHLPAGLPVVPPGLQGQAAFHAVEPPCA